MTMEVITVTITQVSKDQILGHCYILGESSRRWRDAYNIKTNLVNELKLPMFPSH